MICASAGNHAQGVALAARRRGIAATIVMPQTTPQIKVQAVIDLGGEVVLHGDEYDQAYEHALTLARERQLDLHPSLRRSRRDRRAGHDRHGDPAAAARRDDRRDLRRRRRRRADRGHRRLREVPVPEDPHDRRRAGGRGRDVSLAAGAASASRWIASASSPTASRCAGSARSLPAGAAVRRRGHHGQHRRDLRGDPGHLRRQPHDRRAGRRAAGRRHQALRRARAVPRPHVRRDQLRREHELRPPAPRRRARRHRRPARSAGGGGDPGAQGQLPALLRVLGRRSVTEFNYRYNDGAAAQLFVGLALVGRPQGEGSAARSRCARRAIPSST